MKQIYHLNNISKQAHLQAVGALQRLQIQEPLYLNLIEEARIMHPQMGLRSIYETYLPEGIGRDAFIELGKRQGYMLHQQPNPVRTTFSIKSRLYNNLLNDKEFTGVNQLWASDITYYPLNNRFYYLTLLMDVYSRKIIGYSLADNLRAENNLATLQMAMQYRGITDYQNQLIHHSDRGSQYCSNAYTDLLQKYNIRISMCDEVYENTHIERVNGTIKNGYLKHYAIKTIKQLFLGVAKAIQIYNDQRPHQRLPKRMTPNQFEAYLITTPKDELPKLTIFTSSKNKQIDNQLSMNFGS
ncbi:MAG TPA: IS3 family transposase [Chitinophagales bacterium]|nr:IS3 family transposase [Chitinophagales bacterium]HRK28211.1 IS3 family transposase [Chitinophagales bacterium]